MVRTQEPVRPGQLTPRLPRDLETICLKCLEKQPDRRYASALALAADLRSFLDGTPIRARPPRLSERWLKAARRRPALATLAAVSLAAAAMLVAIAVVYSGRMREKNQQLTEALQ